MSALAGGKVFENILLSPINAQVDGLRDTIYLVIVIICVALCLSLWAISV